METQGRKRRSRNSISLFADFIEEGVVEEGEEDFIEAPFIIDDNEAEIQNEDLINEPLIESESLIEEKEFDDYDEEDISVLAKKLLKTEESRKGKWTVFLLLK